MQTNSNIQCTPTLSKLSGTKIMAEINEQSEDNKNKQENFLSESSRLKERMLASKQTKKVVLDKDGIQLPMNLSQRKLQDLDNEKKTIGQYKIDLKCVTEGPNFKITTMLNMKCNMNLENFTVIYTVNKTKEDDKTINFLERLANEESIELEKLTYTFKSKHLVMLDVNEEKCQLTANKSFIIRITILSALFKLIFI